MPSFGTKSKERLATAHEDLQKLFNEVIKYFDCSILYSYRTPEEQFELFKQGREFIDGKWVKTGNVVTYLDGYDKKSKHNYLPSKAVDIWNYPINWNETIKMEHLAGFVLGVAKMMYNNGDIQNEIEWGGNWKSFRDMPHFQLKT